MPSRLFETHYTQRKLHLYHVLEDKLCVWRPTKEEVAQLNDHDIEVTLISGVVPLFEKQKAPLRLMSWCTYRMPDLSKYLLQTLNARCGEPTTTDDLLVSITVGPPLCDTVPALKEWLLQQLLCQVDGRVLPNYCGVLGEFLMDLPLP